MKTRNQSSRSQGGSKKATGAKHSKLGLDIIRGLEELRSHARGEIQLRTRIMVVPDQPAAGSLEDVGKVYRSSPKLNIPVYLDEQVQAYLMQKADTKGVTLSDLVNDLLRREIDIIETVTTK